MQQWGTKRGAPHAAVDAEFFREIRQKARFPAGPALDSRNARCRHRRRVPQACDSACRTRVLRRGNCLKDAFKAPRLQYQSSTVADRMRKIPLTRPSLI